MKRVFQQLRQAYGRFPDTEGCQAAQESGGCDAFCCKVNTPSMYYVEFLYAWTQIVNQWSKKAIKSLVLKAVGKYLSNCFIKGCLFHDSESNRCDIHDYRPSGCRLYGLIPKESWDRRTQAIQSNNPDVTEEEMTRIEKQCDLVSTSDGTIMTETGEQKLFERMTLCETGLGVERYAIELHDRPHGSYRTFHDHIMLELFDEKVLSRLSRVRMTNPTKEDIDKTLVLIGENLNETVSKLCG